jgi:RNA chaperone Hfq
MPPLLLKATVVRRQAAEPVDQVERLAQAAHHQAAEATAITEAATATADQDQARSLDKKRDPHALQSAFLVAHLGRPVTVFLMTGIRMTGKLRQHDQHCVLLEDAAGGINSLVFKHAISTVAPNRP